MKFYMYIGILMRLILGYVRIEVEGYYIERFINICKLKKILIWNLKKQKGVKLYANIGISDFKKLSEICRKTKCRVKIQKKKGVPFLLNRYKKRKIFAIFLIVLLLFIYVSSKYVWNIEVNVEENKEIENIQQDLGKLGVKKGILKKSLDTEKIINEIRLERNDISWMGIDIKGTNVIVNIVKADDRPEIVNNSDYCNIVAKKAGVIEKITAQNGTARVKVGDTVEEGDVLIEGIMEGKYTDPRLVHSMGEVKARVHYSQSEKIYYKNDSLNETGRNEKKFQIKFNNFQINFYKTLSNFKIYDTIYAEYNLKVFSNFYLPISIVEVTNKEKVKEMKNYNKEEAIQVGKENLKLKIEEEIEDKKNILRS